jgi:hypothetical protein
MALPPNIVRNQESLTIARPGAFVTVDEPAAFPKGVSMKLILEGRTKRPCGCAFFAAAFVIAAAPSAYSKEMDTAKITCGAFLASGLANMAAIIMWLRGYHAGKSGIIPYQSPDPYGARLGFYCKQHPNASVIDASEQILLNIGRGL